MKNLLKNINIYLKRKHYINNYILVSIFIIFIVVCVLFKIKTTKNRYVYVDMYGSTGASENCYYNESSRDLRCMIPVKVQQYQKEGKRK